MSENIIRLNPLNSNQILVDEDNPNLIILTDESGVLPDDYAPNSDSTVLGGSDNVKAVGGSAGPNPASIRPIESGNS
jgi:hypothetical protein